MMYFRAFLLTGSLLSLLPESLETSVSPASWWGMFSPVSSLLDSCVWVILQQWRLGGSVSRVDSESPINASSSAIMPWFLKLFMGLERLVLEVRIELVGRCPVLLPLVRYSVSNLTRDASEAFHLRRLSCFTPIKALVWICRVPPFGTHSSTERCLCEDCVIEIGSEPISGSDARKLSVAAISERIAAATLQRVMTLHASKCSSHADVSSSGCCSMSCTPSSGYCRISRQSASEGRCRIMTDAVRG